MLFVVNYSYCNVINTSVHDSINGPRFCQLVEYQNLCPKSSLSIGREDISSAMLDLNDNLLLDREEQRVAKPS